LTFTNVAKELAMAGALRKTMVYLGLAEEDERYDGYDDYDEPASGHEAPAPTHACGSRGP
jgi:cell division inhibitor SepF